MGLLGSLVTVRFGELCSLSDPTEPLVLRALRCSHTFLNEIVASHVPHVFVTLFLSFILFNQSQAISAIQVLGDVEHVNLSWSFFWNQSSDRSLLIHMTYI